MPVHSEVERKVMQSILIPFLQPWEVEGGQKHLRLDLEYLKRNTGARLAELVHEAAYRQTPLSRSIYCNPNNVPKILNGMLIDFVSFGIRK